MLALSRLFLKPRLENYKVIRSSFFLLFLPLYCNFGGQMKKILLAILIAANCINLQAIIKNDITPTKRQYTFPQFTDDYDFHGLDVAIERQLAGFKRTGLKGTIRLGTKVYQKSHLKKTILTFKKMISNYHACQNLKSECLTQLNNQIKANFNLYRPDYQSDEKPQAHFTAYYSPNLMVTKKPHPNYPYPIYAYPKNGQATKFSRVEIDFLKKLKGQKLELFYAKDLFSLYLLHIEGGGMVTVQDDPQRSNFYLSYAGTNKMRWNFISRYMKDQGYIKKGDVEGQRQFLSKNPQLWEEIYGSCPSYVYFKITKTPPVGLNDIPLTDMRSLAQDRVLYRQKGLLSFVEAKKPYRTGKGVHYRRFSRFFLDQDTGGAIKGKARADLYFGVGRVGELAANFLNTQGQIYYLIAK